MARNIDIERLDNRCDEVEEAHSHLVDRVDRTDCRVANVDHRLGESADGFRGCIETTDKNLEKLRQSHNGLVSRVRAVEEQRENRPYPGTLLFSYEVELSNGTTISLTAESITRACAAVALRVSNLNYDCDSVLSAVRVTSVTEGRQVDVAK